MTRLFMSSTGTVQTPGRVQKICVSDKAVIVRMLQVWEATTGRKLYTFEGHEAPVYSVCPHHKESIQVGVVT